MEEEDLSEVSSAVSWMANGADSHSLRSVTFVSAI